MPNPMFNPQPNYSGVTIQIANPTVNANSVPQQYGYPVGNGSYASCPQICCCPPQYYGGYNQQTVQNQVPAKNESVENASMYPAVYPAEYYINDYGKYSGENSRQTESVSDNTRHITNSDKKFASSKNNKLNSQINSENTSSAVDKESSLSEKTSKEQDYSNENNSSTKENNSGKSNISYISEETENSNISKKNINRQNNFEQEQFDAGEHSDGSGRSAVLKHYDDGKSKFDGDLSKSTDIINDIDERDAKIKEEKKNAKDSKIVALTDEYIKSLENYLNNPNDEIRLMASKEILTRLDEDKDRYNDAALNALLNKMLQDPSKLVRIAALSAFGSQLACGNDYTVQLLHNIQSNPSADKEDVLQAADILLKMSAGTEVKHIPNPEVKETQK